jgi:hypothetical protein
MYTTKDFLNKQSKGVGRVGIQKQASTMVINVSTLNKKTARIAALLLPFWLLAGFVKFVLHDPGNVRIGHVGRACDVIESK